MAVHAQGAAPAAPTRWRRFLAIIEPWYDWGTIHVERMEGQTLTSTVEGPVRYFDLQWFGLHIGFQIGPTPKEGR